MAFAIIFACSKIIGKRVMCNIDKKTVNKVQELVAANNLCKGRLFEAVSEYAKLKSRDSHPYGTFDKAGRWYPDTHLGCCKNIRSPSKNFPLSLNKHCRSAEHVANIFLVDKAQLVQTYNIISKVEGDFDNIAVSMCTILSQDFKNMFINDPVFDLRNTLSDLVL